MLNSSTTASSSSAHFGLVARGKAMRARWSPARAPTRARGFSSGGERLLEGEQGVACRRGQATAG